MSCLDCLQSFPLTNFFYQNQTFASSSLFQKMKNLSLPIFVGLGVLALGRGLYRCFVNEDRKIQFVTYNCGVSFADLNPTLYFLKKEGKLGDYEKELAKRIRGKIKDEKSIEDCKTLGDLVKKVGVEYQGEAERELYNELQEKVAERLAKSYDVISLQELKTLDRPFSQILLKTHKIHHILCKEGKQFDTAIAVRKDLFKKVKNHSTMSSSHPDEICPYGQDISAVSCSWEINDDMDIKLMFTSMHNWGFQLYPKDYSKKDYSKNDLKQMEYGRTYVNNALAIQSKNSDCTVMGGDMNNNTDNDYAPFETMENNGFKVHETFEATNLYHGDDETLNYGKREIDYVFTKEKNEIELSGFKKILNILFGVKNPTPVVTISSAKVLKGYDFTHKTNCSDHKPVGITINVSYHLDSVVYRLWQKLFNFVVG